MCAIQKILLLYVASGIVFLENDYIFIQLTYLMILRILRYNYHKMNSLQDILYYKFNIMPRYFISYAKNVRNKV